MVDGIGRKHNGGAAGPDGGIAQLARMDSNEYSNEIKGTAPPELTMELLDEESGRRTWDDRARDGRSSMVDHSNR